jgi:orotate phosphoribosyltransferase
MYIHNIGTAIRESVEILNAAGATLVAVAVSLDRQEKATDASTGNSYVHVCKCMYMHIFMDVSTDV